MLKRIIASILILCFIVPAFGCAKVGEATGKAVKTVKEMPSEFKDGYDKGRNTEEDSK